MFVFTRRVDELGSDFQNFARRRDHSELYVEEKLLSDRLTIEETITN
jgi:hypothetical protein